MNAECICLMWIIVFNFHLISRNLGREWDGKGWEGMGSRFAHLKYFRYIIKIKIYLKNIHFEEFYIIKNPWINVKAVRIAQWYYSPVLVTITCELYGWEAGFEPHICEVSFSLNKTWGECRVEVRLWRVGRNGSHFKLWPIHVYHTSEWYRPWEELTIDSWLS